MFVLLCFLPDEKKILLIDRIEGGPDGARFNFYHDMGCSYHQKHVAKMTDDQQAEDMSKCSLGFSRTRACMAMYALCPALGIDLIQGKHIPQAYVMDKTPKCDER